MLRDQQYKLGLQAVCKMYHLFRLYDDIKECDDKNITFLSYKYVAQRAMESACRWVRTTVNTNDIVYILSDLIFSTVTWNILNCYIIYI